MADRSEPHPWAQDLARFAADPAGFAAEADAQHRARQDDRPPEMRAHPCCRHCTHKSCRCDPPCDFEGHPLPCLRCEQEALWVRFFGPELAAVLMDPDGDALSRALVAARPELAGRVHYVGGRPWCDGINHTTRCEPDPGGGGDG